MEPTNETAPQEATYQPEAGMLNALVYLQLLLSGKTFCSVKKVLLDSNDFKNLHRFNTNFARIANFIKHKDPALSNEIRAVLGEFRRLFEKFFPHK